MNRLLIFDPRRSFLRRGAISLILLHCKRGELSCMSTIRFLVSHFRLRNPRLLLRKASRQVRDQLKESIGVHCSTLAFPPSSNHCNDICFSIIVTYTLLAVDCTKLTAMGERAKGDIFPGCFTRSPFISFILVDIIMSFPNIYYERASLPLSSILDGMMSLSLRADAVRK
jgi:hypothetical protein